MDTKGLPLNEFAVKEPTIFNHIGNKIKTDDREIDIIARLGEPLIVILGNVLSEEECDQLICLSKDRMQRSKISNKTENDLRTSNSMFFQEGENDVVIRVEKRVSQIMNVSVDHGEGIQILNYEVGQEYKAHFDFFQSEANQRVSNPRISTLVMYLNDVESGGETYFPKLNFFVAPKKGMAVYFEYFYEDTVLNELTLHSGAPVIVGEKWAATQWMRRQGRHMR
ncbi:2OG-Fe(II) oxygenase [Evansella sp. AB-P1]|uniref:2OG-Fe(II) oxygenase n=1 Tax=Evansella sp. AB-P1 TaxID=3037653 RepID=UPI00241EC33E|nr:2OG-Fe(II) oxygenase [Evansella sp. AB-P1]MDG5789368.1 2OG-Fe(II) oxygenase [Evansella sp. AB-P1]